MKKRILHILPIYEFGGAERLVLQYAQRMKDEYEIAVANTVEDGKLRPLLEEAGADVFVGSRTKDGGRIGVAKRLFGFVKKDMPDIVHTHLFGGDLFGWLLKKRYPDIVWVSTFHNVEHNTSLLRRIIWKRILRRADTVIAVSERVNAYLSEHFRLPEDMRVVIANGILLEAWAAVPDVKKKAGPVQIATVGRLEHQKGHRFLIDAFASLKEEEWQWHIIGDGSLEEELKNHAARAGIAERCVWHGAVADVPSYLSDIAIVVQPSLWEGLSLVVMEMMAAGKCVIATVPAAAELIEAGETGLVVPIESSEDLTAALRQCFADRSGIAAYGKRARQAAQKRFHINTNVAAVRDIYGAQALK